MNTEEATMTVNRQQAEEMHQALLHWKRRINEQASSPKVFQRRFHFLYFEEILDLADCYKAEVSQELQQEFEFGLNELNELVSKILSLDND